MALTWSLIATLTSRPADNSLTQKLGGFVSGDMVVFYALETSIIKLWRSNDRGVNWSFYDVTGTTGGTNSYGPSIAFDSKYWVAAQQNSLLIHTPSSNPGAGGFTGETMAFSGGHPNPTSSSPFLYVPDTSVGGSPPASIKRRTAASTFTTLEITSGDVWDVAVQIPGTADLLVYVGGGAPGAILRITPSGDPVTIVNTFSITNGTHTQAPLLAAAALTSTDYWVSGSGGDPSVAVLHRTTNGGTSWSETNPTLGFWEAFAAGGREGHGSAYTRFGGTDYCFITYKKSGSGDDRKHVKVAKFNGTTWDAESNDTNDGNRIIGTLVGVNAAGNLDFYAITYDAATDTARVYRTTVTQLAAGIVTSKALCWDFRELPVQGSRWTLHTPFKVGHAIATGGRGDPERIHFVRNDTPRLVEFPSGTTDEGAAISWKWKSRAYAFGAMLWEKGIRQIAAVCLGTTGTIVVDLFEDLAAAAARTYSLIFTGGPHERQSTKRTHADVQGRVIQVQLTGTADTFEASGLEVEPTRKRRPKNP